MKIEVTITKEILEQSAYCNDEGDYGSVGNNCAVALAVRKIFPQAWISDKKFYPFDVTPFKEHFEWHDGETFIEKFDALVNNPEKRMQLPETVVTLEISDKTIDILNKDTNWKEIVNNINHLKLIEA